VLILAYSACGTVAPLNDAATPGDAAMSPADGSISPGDAASVTCKLGTSQLGHCKLGH